MRLGPSDTYTIYGLRVQITEDQPKMQLSADCPVSDDFRQEINAWMVEFFGVTNLYKDGEIIKVGNTLVMNQRTWRKVQSAARQFEPESLGARL